MDTAGVDDVYVVWADLETIWVKDFNPCTLAKPTTFSVSGYGSCFVAFHDWPTPDLGTWQKVILAVLCMQGRNR